jgi:hypothetical protein
MDADVSLAVSIAPKQPDRCRPVSLVLLRAQPGHPAEPGERSEPDIQAGAPGDGDGWFSASPFSSWRASISERRLTARAGLTEYISNHVSRARGRIPSGPWLAVVDNQLRVQRDGGTARNRCIHHARSHIDQHQRTHHHDRRKRPAHDQCGHAGAAGGLRVLGLVSQGEYEILCRAMGASYDP